MQECVFCKIILKKAPASMVYEDEQVAAFLSNHPVNIGHTLVVPKRHYGNIYEIPEEQAAYLFKIAKRLAHAVRDAVDAEGVRIVQNNGVAAGQMVFHLHVHVIPMQPRQFSGGEGAFRDRERFRSQELLDNDAQQIKKKLS